MAFKKNNFVDLRGIISLVILIPLTATTNIDCNGKAFHCVNATHFMICVDLGSGISTTIDDFVIPCPPRTMCQKTNRFECEFAPVTLPTPPSKVKTVQTSAVTASPSTTMQTISTVEVNTESTSNIVSTSILFDILTQSTESAFDATLRNNRSENYTEINVTVEPIYDVTTDLNIGNATAITVEDANKSNANTQRYDINAEVITSPSEPNIPFSKLTAIEAPSSTDAINALSHKSILTNSVTNADEFYEGIQNNTEYVAPESTTPSIPQTVLVKSTTLSQLTSIEMPVTTEAMISVFNDSATNADGLYDSTQNLTQYITARETTTASIPQTDLVNNTILSESKSVDVPSTTEAMISVFNDSATNADVLHNGTQNLTQFITVHESTTSSIPQTDLVISTILSELTSVDMPLTTETMMSEFNDSATNLDGFYNDTQNITQYTTLNEFKSDGVQSTTEAIISIFNDSVTNVDGLYNDTQNITQYTTLNEFKSDGVQSTTEAIISIFNDSVTNVDGLYNDTQNITQYTSARVSITPNIPQTDLVSSTILSELTSIDIPSTTEIMMNVFNDSATNIDGFYNDTQNITIPNIPQTDLVSGTILRELTSVEVSATTESMTIILNDSPTDAILHDLVNNVDGYGTEINAQFTVPESHNTNFPQKDLVRSTITSELTPVEVPSTTEAMRNILNDSVTIADELYNGTRNITIYTIPESTDSSFSETDLVRSTITSKLTPVEVPSTTEAMMSILKNDSVTTADALYNGAQNNTQHTALNNITADAPQADLFRSNELAATSLPSFTENMITTSFNSNQSSKQRYNISSITETSPSALNNTATSENNNLNKSEAFFSNTNTESLDTSIDNLISNITKLDESTITTESVPIYFSTDALIISPEVATETTSYLHKTNTEYSDILYPNTMETTEVRNALFGNTGTVANDIQITKENYTYNTPTMQQSTFGDLPESTQLPLLFTKDLIQTAEDLFTIIDQKTTQSDAITEKILINEARSTTFNDKNTIQNNNLDNTKEIEQDFNGTTTELPHIFDSSNFSTNYVSLANKSADKTDEQISQKPNINSTDLNSVTNINVDSNNTKNISEDKPESTQSVTNPPGIVTEPSVLAFEPELTSTANNKNVEYTTKYVTATTDAYANFKQNDNLPITISTTVFTVDNIQESINVTRIISQSTDMTTSFPDIDNIKGLNQYTQNMMDYTTTESYSASTLENSQTTLDKSMTPEQFIVGNEKREEVSNGERTIKITPVPTTYDIELATTIPVTASIHGFPSVDDLDSESSNTQTFIPLISKDPSISTSQTTIEMSQMVTTQNSLNIDERSEGIMTETTNEMRLERNSNITIETPVTNLKITNDSSIHVTPLPILTENMQKSLNTEQITEGTMVATTASDRVIPSEQNDTVNTEKPVTDLKINNNGDITLLPIIASKTQHSLNMEQIIEGTMVATTPVYQEILPSRYDNNIATETPDTDLKINNNSGILLPAILTSTVDNSLYIDQRTESTMVTATSAYQEILSERTDNIITETPVTDLNIATNSGIGSEVSFENNLTGKEQKSPLATPNIAFEFKHGNGITAPSSVYAGSTANKSTQNKNFDIYSDSEVKYQTEVQTQQTPEMPIIETSVTFGTSEQRPMLGDILITKQEITSTSITNIPNSNWQSAKSIEPVSIAIGVNSNINGLTTPTVNENLVTSTTVSPILNDLQNDNTISTKELLRVTTSGNLAINGIYTQTEVTKSETISSIGKYKDLSLSTTTSMSYESQSMPTSTQTSINYVKIGDGHPEALPVNKVSDVISTANDINIQSRTDAAITGQSEGIHNKASTYAISNLGTLDPVQILPSSLLPVALNSSNDQVLVPALKSDISTSKVQATQETLNSTKQSGSQKITSSQIGADDVTVPAAQNNDRTQNQAKETTISRPTQVSDINNTNIIGTREYKNHPTSGKSESKNTQLNTNRVTVNEAQFSCLNHGRGRYGDNKECRKFYICVGRYQPIVGMCPINTVFSEIRKQCTNNLSHCIRNNQFLCTSEGRFGDYINENTYYICVKNNSNTFMRFRLQCTNGYYLNKTTVKCELKPKDVNASTVSFTTKSSKSSNSDSTSTSEQSKASNPNESQKKSKEKFECDEEGKFADPNNCRKYYHCYRNKKNEFRMKKKKCESEEIFDDDKQKCTENSSRGC